MDKDSGLSSERSHVIRVYSIALGIIALDQLTKWVVHFNIDFRSQEIPVIEGFFKLVYWGNTGSAFSMFSGQNHLLAIIAMGAIVAIFFFRSFFEIHHALGRWAMGLINGGIVGNLIDRLVHNYVVDFLFFYTQRKSGSVIVSEIGFPAFNVADTAITTGIGLIFLLSAKEARKQALSKEKAQPSESEGLKNTSSEKNS